MTYADEMRTEAPHDPTLQEDLVYIAERDLPWEQFRDSRILVTGATGLVGSCVAKALACVNRKRRLNLKILLLVRSAEKASKVFGDLLDRSDLELVFGDLMGDLAVEGPVDYVIHGASVTASKEMVTRPVETIRIAVNGTDRILQLAREKQVRSMVYISSMEAFGITDPALPFVREEDLGYIDLTNVRSCYSEGKRMCELLCTCHSAEYGVPVKIVRLAQTFGAGVSKEEGRVFAQFAKCAMHGEDIVLHTRGESTGNYCYTADAVAGLLTVLLKGENRQIYTAANPRASLKIREMAAMAAEKLAGGKIRVVYDIPESALTYGYAPDVEMHLNSDKLQSLGWKPEKDLPEMYERLIASFRSQGLE